MIPKYYVVGFIIVNLQHEQISTVTSDFLDISDFKLIFPKFTVK